MRVITIQVETPEDENRIAEFIIDAVAEYMRDHELDLKYMNNIKLQKLAFRVVDALDIPLTRSWYMRGCYVYNPIIDREFLREKINDVCKKEKSEEYKLICDTVSKNIGDVWWTSTTRFLDDLYREQAPKIYRNIYISNNNILNLNKELEADLRNYIIGKDLSKWFSLNTNYYQRIAKNISDLHIGLASRKEFESIIIPFSDFTDILEMLYLKIDNILNTKGDFSNDILKFFKEANDVYFNNIWQYPALIISKETVVGIRKDEIIKENTARLKSANDSINQHTEQIKEEASILNLLPSIKELEAKYKESVKMLGEGVSKSIADFWKIYAMYE